MKTFPTLMADKISPVLPMSTALNGNVSFKYVSENMWKEGDLGHDWLYGYFMVNEKGEQIYFKKNPDEYFRLKTKYIHK